MSRNLFGYSNAEKKLIAAISSHWAGVIEKCNINPPELYAILAQEVFIENRQGNEVEALRKACVALQKCKIYRLTPEFDSLCEFDLETSES